jgi:hypothetical protein
MKERNVRDLIDAFSHSLLNQAPSFNTKCHNGQDDKAE